MLSATGRIRAPVDRAPYPRTNWKYCVIRKMKPNSAKNVTVTAPLAALKRRSRNRLRSSIGCATRRSTRTKTSDEQRADSEPDEGPRGRPAVLGRLDDRVDEREEHRHRQAEPRQVERRHRRVARLGHEHVRRPGREQGERRQRPEDAAPREVLEQQPTDHRSGRDADADHGAPDAERGRALAALAEGVADDRQRGREDHRGGRSHREPGRDQRSRRVDHGADHAGRGEADQTEDQRRPTAVAVGEAAGGEHQRGEGQVVAVDDPLQRAGAGVEIGGDARQRDVDDRGVEVDGEHGRTDREQDGELGSHRVLFRRACGQ